MYMCERIWFKKLKACDFIRKSEYFTVIGNGRKLNWKAWYLKLWWGAWALIFRALVESYWIIFDFTKFVFEKSKAKKECRD